MPTFVMRLIAPRPNFAQSLTDAEREIMGSPQVTFASAEESRLVVGA